MLLPHADEAKVLRVATAEEEDDEENDDENDDTTARALLTKKGFDPDDVILYTFLIFLNYLVFIITGHYLLSHCTHLVFSFEFIVYSFLIFLLSFCWSFCWTCCWMCCCWKRCQ